MNTHLAGSAEKETPAKGKLDHKKFYRLPWSFADNAIAWLEPTKKCNLYCEGCYSEARGRDDKPLEQVKDEVLTYLRLRNFDSMSISGGEPLLHPDIVEIVRYVAQNGLKPIINTNGLALTEELLFRMKEAGLVGVTVHVDSKQKRPGWEGKNEVELNELRHDYAKMVNKIGGILCGFNSTVYEDTLKYVPEIVRWSEQHIDIVNIVVFIAYRAAILDQNYDYYAGNAKLEIFDVPYATSENLNIGIGSTELYDAIKKEFPDFESAAYLNGTADPTSVKWLLTTRLGNTKEILGYLGPRFAQLVQIVHHFKWGKYLAYPKRWALGTGRSLLLLFPLDKTLRKAFFNLVKNPIHIFRKVYVQSIMFIQPIDMMPDGSPNMCDSCPDVSLWNGQLVWSCRLEEPLKFGCFVRAVPRQKNPFPPL